MTASKPPDKATPAPTSKTADPAPTLGPPPGVPATMPNIAKIEAESPARNGVIRVPTDAPAMAPRRPRPILWSVKFREPMTLAGLTPIELLCPHDNEKQKDFEIVASGPFIYVAMPRGRTDGLLDTAKKPSAGFADAATSAGYGPDPVEALPNVRRVVEVPRQMVVTTWLVDGQLVGGDIARAIQDGLASAPDRGVLAIRKERADRRASALVAAATQRRPVAETLGKPKADDGDDLDDEVGYGEESEPEAEAS